MNYIFFGSDEFSAGALKILQKNGFVPRLIIDSKKKLETNRDKIAELKPDLFIIASFGKILDKTLIGLPKKGTIIAHPSLLPELRGPSPIQTALLESRKKTGVTIILADEKVDHGPILAQEEIEIKEDDDYESLMRILGEKSGELLVKIIPLYLAKKIQPKEQNHSKTTFTHVFKKEDGKIDWSQDSEKILNRIRALNPWPSAYTFWQDEKGKKNRLIILKAAKSNIMSSENINIAGAIVFKGDFLLVKTGDGFLKIIMVKPEGKKPMAAEDFFRGHSYLNLLSP